jgi:hypothetical protein
MHISLKIATLFGVVSVAAAQDGPGHDAKHDRKVCAVSSGGSNATDDAPAILTAFDNCGRGGTVLFKENTTYYVNTVMNVSGLQDCYIDLRGTLVVSRDQGYC